MQTLLAQIAHAAVRTKNSFWEGLYARWLPRLGAMKALWAVAHRLLRLVWKILAGQVRYQEQGRLARDAAQLNKRMTRLRREFAAHGYVVSFTPHPLPAVAEG